MLRRGLDAVVRSAELGEVEVAREDLLFRHLLLDRHGEAGFVELAADRPLRGLGDELLVARGPPALDDCVLHVLLRDRGSARGGAAGQIVHEGPGQPLDVDAVVPVEPAVLDGRGGVLHMLRDLVRRNHDSVLRVETGDLGAVRGQEHRLLGGLLGVSSNIDVTALTLVPAVAAKGMAIPASRTPPRQHTPRSALTRMAI